MGKNQQYTLSWSISLCKSVKNLNKKIDWENSISFDHVCTADLM